MSKNLEAVVARLAKQEAYVARTQELGFALDPGTKTCSRGTM